MKLVGLRANFSAERFFLVAALLINTAYILTFSNLSTYYHGSEAFLHVASLAYRLEGKKDTLPVSFLELLYQDEPNIERVVGVNTIPKVAANACQWRRGLRERYCEHWNPARGHVSFSQLASIPLNPGDVFHFISHPHAAQYPVISYAPYVAGAWLGIVLHLPPVIILYMAVFANMAVNLALGFYIIRLFPFLRWLMCYILMLPAAFMFRSYIMPDALLLNVCLLILALALRWAITDRPLGPRRIAAMFALSALVGLLKVAYFLVPLAFLAIPARRFGNKERKAAAIMAAVAISAVTAVLWGFSAHNNAPHSPSLIVEKLGALFSPPILPAVIHTVTDGGWITLCLNSLISWNRYWMLQDWQFVLALLPLLLLLLEKTARPPQGFITPSFRLANSAIFIGTVGLVFVAMYFYFDTIFLMKLDKPNGIEGRYFLPTLPFLLFASYPAASFHPRFQAQWDRAAVFLSMACLLWLNIRQLSSPIGIL